jgi:SagB-type dehydrogenase family enzyme
MGAVEDTLAYHERSKHRPNRYAAGPGYLDWSNQPNPWRSFAGSPEQLLPLAGAAALEPGSALDLGRMGALLERALGLSAWKQHGSSRWALRCNPSSGNLHPTEAYVLTPAVGGLQGGAGVYHYRSRDHALEQRCSVSDDDFERLMGMLPDGLIVGLSSIEWREAWKYGERAFRYCHLDLGHAVASLSYAAATLGLRTTLLAESADPEVAALLGLDRDDDFEAAEREHPDALVLVSEDAPVTTGWPDAREVARMRSQRWRGHANALSAERTEWAAITKVELATRKLVRGCTLAPARGPLAARRPPPEAGVLLGRRSALDFERARGISRDQFFSILDGAVAHRGSPPWDAIGWEPMVHLVLCVHDVQGLAPGLYVMPRRAGASAELREAMSSDWEWEPVDAPEGIELFVLGEMAARNAAGYICCQQAIAADAAVSVGMLAEFEGVLRSHGAWAYRRLYWECGAVGHALYVGAEAAGLRATGIGCYYDDLMHEWVGLQGRRWQSLYHLALGTPVEDPRITTLPPYGR